MGRVAHDARNSGGAVLVLVALMLPALIGAGGLVIDVGNWFSHKRHLQVEADAGVLAAAGRFRVPCTASVITDEAALYSSVGVAGYNPQVGGTPQARLHKAINSTTFFGQASPVDSTVVTGDPCTAKMIDLKLTETDVPWFLRLAGVTPFINAQARVEIKPKTTGEGSLPIGVPDTGPRKARALFVDETTGGVLGTAVLSPTGTSGGLSIWSSAGSPISVPISGTKIGVRILLSGGSTANPSCGDPLVDCYGAGTNTAIVANTAGLAHIRGYSTAGVGTASVPIVRSATMLAGTCTEDGYFTATVAAGSCSAGVSATIQGLASTATVFAQRVSGANTKVPLTFNAGGIWQATSGIPITTGEGSVPINLFFGNGNGTQIGSTFVQRAYAGNETAAVSGPVKMVSISESNIAGANSFPLGSSHSLVVTVGLKPSLQTAQSTADPIISLKLAGGGSQNQSLDCDNDPTRSNLRDELSLGCAPKYTVNDGSALCPGSSGVLWATAQPWSCVALSTGAQVGQVTQGMNLRIVGSANGACTSPNHWSSFPNIPAGDRRVVGVILTPFGAFSGSGGGTVPVIGFANFYVTGWDGGACQGSGDDPAGQGAIVGHYIKNIDTLNSGGGAGFCDFNAVGTCVAVLTR